MKPRTELLLYMLEWAAGRTFKPSMRHQIEGFERWAWRNGLLRRIQQLEAKEYASRGMDEESKKSVLKLTEAGMRAALGGRDPQAAWDAPWDGKWRLFLFDLPAAEVALRKKFLRALRSCGCGCLQDSVWITTALPDAMRPFLDGPQSRPGSLILLEALSRGPEFDRQMVADAWNFQRVREAYAKLAAVLGGLPAECDIPQVIEWAAQEKAATEEVLAIDPLLPRELCPKDYPGFEKWNMRQTTVLRAFEVFGKVGG